MSDLVNLFLFDNQEFRFTIPIAIVDENLANPAICSQPVLGGYYLTVPSIHSK